MEEKPRSRYHRILSFKYALEGIITATREEPNLKFHLFFALLVIFSAWFFQLSPLDWIILLTMIGLVLTLEMTNTAIEAVVDSFTEKEHPRAKYAKDISAGAVLIITIAAIIVGVIIFLPYLKAWIT